jgi:hypothetical protein
METAAELHEARVLRARIEVKEAELAAHAALSGNGSPGDLERLAAEIGRLRADYRRLLACQADRDYRRRRAEWRAQQSAARAREGNRNCACA